MKKKLFAAVLVCTMAVSLAACGGGSAASASSGSGSAGSASSSTGSGNDTAVSLEAHTVDVGDYTVEVPAGWLGVPMADYMADTGEDGEPAVATNNYCMIKGGENEADIFSKPAVYVYYYDDTSADQQIEWATMMYDESEDMDISVNGNKCYARRCKSDMSYEDSETPQIYVYDVVMIPVSENSCLGVTLVAESPDFKETVSASDSDVMGMMESIKVKEL